MAFSFACWISAETFDLPSFGTILGGVPEMHCKRDGGIEVVNVGGRTGFIWPDHGVERVQLRRV